MNRLKKAWALFWSRLTGHLDEVHGGDIITREQMDLLLNLSHVFEACENFTTNLRQCQRLNQLVRLIKLYKNDIGAHIGAESDDQDAYQEERLEDILQWIAGNGSTFLGSMKDMTRLRYILQNWEKFA